MTRPRSQPRSGASSRPGPDLAALRRELYRPGADRDAVEAYLAAAEAEGAPADGGDVAPIDRAAREGEPAVPEARPPVDAASKRLPRWHRALVPAAVAAMVPAVGIALLQPAGTPAPRRPGPGPTGPAVAPAVFSGLRGASTVLVALPWRTSRVRLRLTCGGPSAPYTWTALGQDPQTEQFIPVLSHAGASCSPTATYLGPLPGDVSNLRIRITVDGPYALAVDPL